MALFKVKSRNAKNKPNHDFFKVKPPLGLEREFFEKSNRAMREIISKPNHVLFFKSNRGMPRTLSAAVGMGRR
jgi:hypothetical protein